MIRSLDLPQNLAVGIIEFVGGEVKNILGELL